MAGATRTQVRIWEKQVDEHVKQEVHLVENLKTVYSLIYGQCSDALRMKLESGLTTTLLSLRWQQI